MKFYIISEISGALIWLFFFIFSLVKRQKYYLNTLYPASCPDALKRKTSGRENLYLNL